MTRRRKKNWHGIAPGKGTKPDTQTGKPDLVPAGMIEAMGVAEATLKQGHPETIADLLARFDSDSISDTAPIRRRFRRLYALGLAAIGRCAEAEKQIGRAIELDESSPDIYYAQTQVQMNLRDFEQAARSGEKYLELVARSGDLDFYYCTDNGSQARVLLWVGRAYAETGELAGAQPQLSKSLELEPNAPETYLELWRVFNRLNRPHEATAVLDLGLHQCTDTAELEMVRQVLTDRPRISVCMIVKNEEQLLPECLESVRDWVDEIIVVDTGSIDRTIEIARQYGARVFEQAWEDNFSKPRNFSIEQATGDWIFILDADERLVPDDIPIVIDAMCAKKQALLSVGIHNEYPETNARTTYSNSVRLFRRDLNLRYAGIVHNALQMPPDVPVLNTPARIRHLGYGLTEAKMRAKFERTRKLLRQQLAENGGDIFAWFNYAELLRGSEPVLSPDRAKEVIEAAGKVIEFTDPASPVNRHLHLMSLNQLASTYLVIGEYEVALSYCERALQMRPDYLDGLINLGLISYRLEKYGKAIAAFEKYLEAQAEFKRQGESEPMILCFPDARDLAHNNLGILYELSGDFEKAKHHYQRTLEINPAYRDTASLLGRLFLSVGDHDAAESWFKRQLKTSDSSPLALVGLAAVCRESGNRRGAISYLTRATLEFPDNPTVFLELGRTLLETGEAGEIREACKAFDQTIAISEETSEAEQGVANSCFEMEQYAMAGRYYLAAMEKSGPDSKTRNDLGNCYFKLGDLAEAEQQYRLALEISPVTPLAYRNLGLTCARSEKLAEAARWLEKYLDIERSDRECRRLAADLRFRSGDYAGAINHYEALLEETPADEAALVGWSESYLLAGHQDVALRGYQHLLRLNPESDLARDRLSKLTPQTIPQ